MRHQQHPAARVGLAAEGRPQVSLGRGIQGARGLVEPEHGHAPGPRAVQRPRDGDALGLTARESRTGGAERRGGVEVRRPRVGQRRGDAPGIGRGAEGDVVGHRSGHQPGPLARPGDRAARVRNRGAVDAHRAVVRRETQHRSQQRRLADAARAGHQHDLARTDRQRHLRQHVPLAPNAYPVERQCRSAGGGPGIRFGARASRVQRVEDLLRRGHPLARGVELHAHLPQRQIRLGGEEQHEEPDEQREVPGEQAEPDRHGDDGDRDGCQELQREAREERHAQHGHRLALVVAGDHLDGVGRAVLPAERLERSEPVDGVGEARREPAQRAVLLLLHAARGQADQHHEERDERDRQHHRQTRERVGEGHRADEDRHRDRGSDQLREVAAEVRVERLEAVAGGHREGGGVALAEPARTETAHRGDQGLAQLRRGRRRPASRGALGGGDQQPPEQGEGCRGPEVAPQLADRLPLDRAHQRARERPREADDRARLGEDDRRAHREEAAGGGGVVEQPRVDGFHGISARRARPSRSGRG